MPLTKDTRGLIGAAELARMKDGVRLVPDDVLAEIRALPHIRSATLVRL